VVYYFLQENDSGCVSGSLLDIHKWRIIKLRTKQVELSNELDQAKSRLLLEGTRWSFYRKSIIWVARPSTLSTHHVCVPIQVVSCKEKQ
jgi:hypothetical protein